MLGTISYSGKSHAIDFSKPLDISIPLRDGGTNVTAWYAEPPRISPHRDGDFVAQVSEGASVNFNNIWFNPHAHGTHTECLGHITKEGHSVNDHLNRFFFAAEVVTIAPEKRGRDFVISRKQLEYVLGKGTREAVVIRTLPNTVSKLSRKYALTNPPYMLEAAALFLREKGILHLLVDLPSVDPEKDDGALRSHKAFWDLEGTPRTSATITELVYVPNSIPDGKYFLELQVAPFVNDASPSRPVLYKLES